ncbi:MAG: hypothetical protein A3I14_06515 [Candidatus Rokubacteria bacterium RIFCSPLOWO2_02_FULL_73_56]|nr:MAG: hypothetical protein A3I14_06515 [Candidatus Rokubacteria bacterium RIFCSPLOWO2_02_FULL_73_56]
MTVDVLWSLVVPSTRSGAMLEQDLYLLWPGEVNGEAGGGPPDPALARYVRERGLTPVREGRLHLYARGLYGTRGARAAEPIAGGAPFVTFVQEGGPLGVTPRVTYVRIPWHPRMINRTWLMGLRMELTGLLKPVPATWVERLFWGRRHTLTLSYNEVRGRGIFPMYFEHRERLLRLADEPSQLLAVFAQAEQLKIHDVFPRTASRRAAEARVATEIVSLFLDHAEGLVPQVLTVQFGYYSRLQAWAPVLITALVFALGNMAGPLLVTLARHLGPKLAGRFHVGPRAGPPRERQVGTIVPRDVLERLVPGQTTYEDVLRLCGVDAEEHEQFGRPEHRRLVYRGRRTAPRQRRRFGWVSTVDRWEVEHHEVEITLERDVVSDVQAHVRRSRLAQPEPG